MKINFNTKTTCGDDDDDDYYYYYYYYYDDDKYIKTKIKIHKDNITTNFYNKIGSKKVPKEKIPHKC